MSGRPKGRSLISTNHPENSDGITQELVEKFLAVQSDEIKLRTEQLQLSRREIDNSHELSKQSIQANLEDRKAQRGHQSELVKYGLIFCGSALAALLIFGAYMASLNKEAVLAQMMNIASEVIKYIAGAIIGYAVAVAKNKSSKSEQDDSDE